MEARTLNCPGCGAAVASDAVRCQYCDSQLATVACPSCFGMMFLGAKHCPNCGAAAERVSVTGLSLLTCPGCKTEMSPVLLGTTAVRECPRCEGLWVDVPSFEKICTDREQQSAVLGAASPEPAPATTHPATSIRYVPCPECGRLMNRVNFAHCAGVIVDVCKGHGTWFDRDELRRIVEFIRAGGLEAARRKEKLEIELARAQLRDQEFSGAGRLDRMAARGGTDDDRLDGVSATRSLLDILLH